MNMTIPNTYLELTDEDLKSEEIPNVHFVISDNVTHINAALFGHRNNLTCQKKKCHIGFLKVHKAGSTTMQNLFFRFGMKHDLRFALNNGQSNYLLSKNAAKPLKAGQHYDIFALHTIYKKQLFDSLLPADSVYIGIVRDPLERMISAAFFYRDVFGVGYLKRIPKKRFIHDLVNFPEKYDNQQFSFTKNSMGKDFGFTPGNNSPVTINNKLHALENEFKLVLVMERFEESLILMKRTLGWSLSDVIFLKKNSNMHTPVVLTDAEKSKFRSTCLLDYAIFDRFSERFDQQVNAEGKSFADEVNHFNAVLDHVHMFCGMKNEQQNTKPSLLINKSIWNEAFVVSKSDCDLMNTGEIQFINILKKRHMLM